jgi:hypothetical protein
MVERAGEAAKLGFKAHPHMLRHACGFALANAGHDTRATLPLRQTFLDSNASPQVALPVGAGPLARPFIARSPGRPLAT